MKFDILFLQKFWAVKPAFFWVFSEKGGKTYLLGVKVFVPIVKFKHFSNGAKIQEFRIRFTMLLDERTFFINLILIPKYTRVTFLNGGVTDYRILSV